MTIHRPTYATRRMVKRATDIATTANFDDEVDSALEAAATDIDNLCHRRFYNKLETAYFDWPNFQRAYPWRIWLEGRELATVDSPVPVVTSGGVVIPAGNLVWGPWNYAPPYTKVEISRGTTSAFGGGSSPQRSVSILGLFGYWKKSAAAGTLAAAVSDTTGTTITVSDSSKVDAGDVVTVGSETMLVQDTGMISTGQTQSGSGCSTAQNNDNLLTVADGTQLHKAEIIQLDGERMLITSVTGNIISVKRSYDGSVLAVHTNATVYALRSLTVTRGDFGSVAATHLNGTSVTVEIVPGDVREMARGEAENTVKQMTSAYGRTIGENGARTVPGGSLPDLRRRVYQNHGRKARTAVI